MPLEKVNEPLAKVKQYPTKLKQQRIKANNGWTIL